jgi:hypothetical protein
MITIEGEKCMSEQLAASGLHEVPDQQRAAFEGLRRITAARLERLGPEIVSRVDSLTLMFSTNEAAIGLEAAFDLVVIYNPGQGGQQQISFEDSSKGLMENWQVSPDGTMRLDDSGESRGGRWGDHLPDLPEPGQLGRDFVDNFEFYRPLLERADAEAVIELPAVRPIG